MEEIKKSKGQIYNKRMYDGVLELFKLQNDIDKFKNKYPKIIQFTEEESGKLDTVSSILQQIIVNLKNDGINNDMNANSFYSYNQWISEIKESLSKNPENNKKMINEFIINIDKIANELDELHKQKINDNKELVNQMQEYKEAASLGNMEFPESIFQVQKSTGQSKK